MATKLTAKQEKWLRTLKPIEVKAWLAQGKPEASGPLWSFPAEGQDSVMFYQANLRGVLLGGRCETEGEALKVAADARDLYRSETASLPVPSMAVASA